MDSNFTVTVLSLLFGPFYKLSVFNRVIFLPSLIVATLFESDSNDWKPFIASFSTALLYALVTVSSRKAQLSDIRVADSLEATLEYSYCFFLLLFFYKDLMMVRSYVNWLFDGYKAFIYIYINALVIKSLMSHEHNNSRS